MSGEGVEAHSPGAVSIGFTQRLYLRTPWAMALTQDRSADGRARAPPPVQQAEPRLRPCHQPRHQRECLMRSGPMDAFWRTRSGTLHRDALAGWTRFLEALLVRHISTGANSTCKLSACKCELCCSRVPSERRYLGCGTQFTQGGQTPLRLGIPAQHPGGVQGCPLPVGSPT